MRILALSNFYPPHHVSGYAMLCADVMEALRQRGHEITVLTSTLGCNGERVEGGVHRLLTLESPLEYYRPVRGLLYPVADRRNLAHLRRLVDDTQPDVIFVWGMWNLSKRLAREAENLAGPNVVYYLANPWPIEPNQHRAFWSLPTRRPWLNPVKSVCRQVARLALASEWRDVPLRFDRAPCCSTALRDQLIRAGVPLKDAPTIYEGIDIGPYVEHGARRRESDGRVLSVVYVGLLVPHKGVHTAIEALARLPAESLERVRLTVLGSGHPNYERELQALVARGNLAHVVSFVKPIPRSALPEFLSRHDVLLLPSIWEEPLALIMQEGLASGLAVVGSATGGTREIIRHDENGLLFEAEDANRLAQHIRRLVADRSLCRRLASRGQETARALFDLRRMVDDIETYLVATGANPQPV